MSRFHQVAPEGELFEALKETITGDHADGRYARNVLGEGVILEEGVAVELQNAKVYVGHLKTVVLELHKLVTELPPSGSINALSDIKKVIRSIQESKKSAEYAGQYVKGAKKRL